MSFTDPKSDCASKENSTGWFITQERRTEDAINHIKRVLGTFMADQDLTLKFMEGYLVGIKSMHRQAEEDRVELREFWHKCPKCGANPMQEILTIDPRQD